jgi:hypothetical protein
MRYFYVTWECIHGTMHGCQVLKQQNPSGGLDIPAASEWLFKTFNEPILVMNWQELSLEQYTRMENYIEKCRPEIAGPKPKAKEPGVILTLKKGGRDAETQDHTPVGQAGERKDDDGPKTPGTS